MSLNRFRRPVVIAAEHETADVVARRMRDAHVGCVVIVRSGRPIGLITDRDIAIRVVAEGRAPERTLLSEIATYDPIVLQEDDDLLTVSARIAERGVRRFPIVNPEGRVVGIVTADDLVLLLGRELAGVCDGLNDAADTSDSR